MNFSGSRSTEEVRTFSRVARRIASMRSDGISACLIPDIPSQRLEAALQRDTGLGLSFGFVWKIKVLQLVLAVGGENFGLELVGQLSLFFDRSKNGIAAVLEILVVVTFLVDVAYLDLVEIPRRFLPVPRYKGNRRPLFQQIERRFHTRNRRTYLFADSKEDFRIKHAVKQRLCQKFGVRRVNSLLPATHKNVRKGAHRSDPEFHRRLPV